MQITYKLPDEFVEHVVRGIMDNFPEASAGLSCSRWKYDTMDFTFHDEEGGKEYKLDKAKLLATFPLLFTDKWPKGCTKPPMSGDLAMWDDWLCQCDATDFDAFVQLACLGEVICG